MILFWKRIKPHWVISNILILSVCESSMWLCHCYGSDCMILFQKWLLFIPCRTTIVWAVPTKFEAQLVCLHISNVTFLLIVFSLSFWLQLRLVIKFSKYVKSSIIWDELTTGYFIPGWTGMHWERQNYSFAFHWTFSLVKMKFLRWYLPWTKKA